MATLKLNKDYGKIYVIFIEFCMQRLFWPHLREIIPVIFFRIKSGNGQLVYYQHLANQGFVLHRALHNSEMQGIYIHMLQVIIIMQRNIKKC